MKAKHLIAAALIAAFSAVAVSGDLSAADRKKLTFGVAPGPYGDLVKFAVKPFLEKKGYEIELKEFSDYVQPNIALGNKSIDANVYQHRVYLEKFSADNKLALSPVINIPTAALGLYSKKHASLADLKEGSTVTIANDPSNLARALRFLQSLGYLKIKASIDPAKASEKDIAENPKKLVISPVEAAQLPRTLDSVDFSVVNGNYAIVAGIYPTALKREVLEEKYINLIAVRTADLNEQYVKDIKAVVESKEFAAVIDDPKYAFKDFQKPEWLKKKLKK